MKGTISIALLLSVIGMAGLCWLCYAGLAVSGLVPRVVAIIIALAVLGVGWLCLWFGIRAKRERAYMKNWSTVGIVCAFFLMLDVVLAIWPAMIGANYYLDRKDIQKSLDRDRLAMLELRDEAFLVRELNRAELYRDRLKTLITAGTAFPVSLDEHVRSVYFSDSQNLSAVDSGNSGGLTVNQVDIKFTGDTSAITTVCYDRASYRGSIDEGIERLSDAVNDLGISDIVEQSQGLTDLMQNTAFHFTRTSASLNLPDIDSEGEVSAASTANEYTAPASDFIEQIGNVTSFSWGGMGIAIAFALLACFVYWITPPTGQGSIDYKKPKKSDAYGLVI